jgi:hypothetical protein
MTRENDLEDIEPQLRLTSLGIDPLLQLCFLLRGDAIPDWAIPELAAAGANMTVPLLAARELVKADGAVYGDVVASPKVKLQSRYLLQNLPLTIFIRQGFPFVVAIDAGAVVLFTPGAVVLDFCSRVRVMYGGHPRPFFPTFNLVKIQILNRQDSHPKLA